MKKMRLSQILFSQGFGTRRLCAGLIYNGEVSIGGGRIGYACAVFGPQGLGVVVHGKASPFWE